jgi:hypothetical protein
MLRSSSSSSSLCVGLRESKEWLLEGCGSSQVSLLPRLAPSSRFALGASSIAIGVASSAYGKCKNVTRRAGANGARIRNLHVICFINEALDLMLVHKKTVSRGGVRDHFRKSFRCRLDSL